MRIFFKSISYLFFLILVVVLTYTLFAFYGYFGSLEPGGKSINSELPKKVLNSKIRSQLKHSNSSKQILFGDTHVHTTYSSDAFLWSLPMYNGRGPHPVSDACDYARFCSALDFWVISDHAEASTPHKWNNTIEQVQSCNKSTDPENPDMITFLGFEWTQIGDNREEHYGHKNVILKEIDSEYLPQSPIAAGGDSLNNFRDPNRVNETRINMMVQAYSDLGNRQRYYDFIAYNTDITSSPVCTGSADDNKDCLASADTPKELFTKLNALKTDSIVIPHGNTWGFYSPLGTSWDDKLDDVHDPDRQISFEIMSGHGNSEEYRSWTEVIFDGDNLICPEESDNYLPSCKQAGNIIYERCIENGKRENECRQDASQAEIFYLQAGQSGHFVVPGATPESWLDSGQCKDCFIPSFNYRPKGSFQYALTKKGRNNEKFIFGVIASSDNHRARPGTGYKAVDRLLTTESNGIKDPAFERLAYPLDEISDTPVEFKIEERFIPNPLAYWESERQETFFTTGGLAAVHVDSRSREGVWEAFKRRETYGTSGPRILLWFDLITENGLVPMGSEITIDENSKKLVISEKETSNIIIDENSQNKVVDSNDDGSKILLEPNTLTETSISNETSAIANERTPKEEMVLKSSGNSWVEIEDLDGNSYLTRLMRSGETFVVPDKKGLTLSTGNAGVLSLTFGSTHISKLGSVGEVISSRPLNIEAFQKR